MSNKKYYICKMENKVRCRVINRSLFLWKNTKTSGYLFNAKELDEESGMYYYGTRYYAPPVFISRDSLFEKFPTMYPLRNKYYFEVPGKIMKVERKITLILLLLFFFMGESQLFAQEKECLYADSFKFAHISLALPCEYRKSEFYYEEGMFLSFTYEDSSTIVIFRGTMVNLPLLKEENGYIPSQIKTDTISDRIIRYGNQNNKFWREDNIAPRLRIYYNNVSLQRKEIFDKTLYSLQITPCN